MVAGLWGFVRRLSFGQALVLSLLVHGAVYGAGQAWMEWRRHRTFDAMEIDLSHSSLMPLPPNMGRQQAYKPPEEWYVGDARKLAPAPIPVPTNVVVAKVEEQEAPAGPPCPAPCPDNAGDWAPSSQSVKKPSWLEGMISEDDYPKEARMKNITGLVVVQVLLDASGAVRDVKLLQGSDQTLNDRTLEKLRQARFSPCVDASGQPFPCTLRLPINWSLE
jgi:TonB family protein